MTGGVPRCVQDLDAGLELLIAVDDVVALSRRPIDGTRVTVVPRWAELELCPADDD